MNSDIKKELTSILSALTVAFEKLEHIKEPLIKSFKDELYLQNKIPVINRKSKRILDKKIDALSIKAYSDFNSLIKSNNKLLSHYDNSLYEKAISKKVDKIYNFLDEKVHI